MTKEDAIRHCIACCDGALTDEQRNELYSRIGGAIEVEREACAKIADDQAQVFLSPEYAVNQPMSSHAERFACGQVAAAIRARSNPST